MPRKPRIEFPGALYHVISRGNNRQIIFEDAKDFEEFLRSLTITQRRFPFKLFAYVLMTNHFHLLVETAETPLSVIMRSLLARYSRYFNRRHKKIGHLFAARYKAILCQKNTYLLELVRYIHLNPVRAKMVTAPAEWRWSSHGNYTGKMQSSIVSANEVLSQFSPQTQRAKLAYCEFVRAGVNHGHKNDLYPSETVPLLGNAEFVKQITKQKEPRRNPARLLRIKLDALADGICRHSEIDLQSLQGKSRERVIASVRAVFAFVAIRHAGHSVSNVARFLNVHPSAITKAMRKANQSLDAKQSRLLQQIVSEIPNKSISQN